ncbi:MAG TPA: hypothetical protein VNR00_03195 [Opitutus sp.]|nr:hypothetical protein [Opitutus sp.]
MKPPFLLILFAASFFALLALPLSFEAAVSPIAVSGLLVLLSTDYRRRTPLAASPVRRTKTRERLGLAA